MQFKKFIKTKKFEKESLVLKNILLHSKISVVVSMEFFDMNDKLNLIKTLNKLNLFSYNYSIKAAKLLLKNNKYFTSLFSGKGTLFYLKNNNEILDFNKFNSVFKKSKANLLGTFIDKKFYKWNKFQIGFKTHIDFLLFLINIRNIQLKKWKNLLIKK